MVAVLAWSLLFAVLGQLFLRPVGSCGGPRLRCTGLVDLGAGLASWGPLVASAVMLAAIAWSVSRRRRSWPAAMLAVVAVVGLQALGQALIPLGVVPR